MDIAKTKAPTTKKSVTLVRLLKFIINTYKFSFWSAMVAIIISAASTVMGSLFLQKLIDNYILPMTKEKVPN